MVFTVRTCPDRLGEAETSLGGWRGIGRSEEKWDQEKLGRQAQNWFAEAKAKQEEEADTSTSLWIDSIRGLIAPATTEASAGIAE